MATICRPLLRLTCGLMLCGMPASTRERSFSERGRETAILSQVRSPTSWLWVNSRWACQRSRCGGSSIRDTAGSLLGLGSAPSARGAPRDTAVRGEEGKRLLTARSPQRRALGFSPVSGSANEIRATSPRSSSTRTSKPKLFTLPPKPALPRSLPPIHKPASSPQAQASASASCPWSTLQSRRSISPPPAAALLQASTFPPDSCRSLLAGLPGSTPPLPPFQATSQIPCRSAL